MSLGGRLTLRPHSLTGPRSAPQTGRSPAGRGRTTPGGGTVALRDRADNTITWHLIHVLEKLERGS